MDRGRRQGPRRRQCRVAVAAAQLALMALAVSACGQQVLTGYVADQVSVVGYSDLDGRPGFKLAIKEVNGRWYLYMGHLWHRGWTIVDVTDPARPTVAKFVPGPDNTWTIQMDLHDDIMITALQGFSKEWGADPDKPFDEGVLIWDISDPVNPTQLGHFKTGGRGTHRNQYPGGQYMHLAANMPGYQGQIYVIVDISDPANPTEAGRWWVPGQHTAGGETSSENYSIHGPPHIAGNRAYLPYQAAGMIILDISDVSKPTLIGQLDFNPPFRGAVHTVVPIPERQLAYTNSEAIAESCAEPLNQASLVDISDPSKPRLVSIFPVPEPPGGSPYADFCDKGGRFGPHNVNQNLHSPDVEPQGDLIYLTYFNAGLRIYNIADPEQPREVGYFIPPDPQERIGPIPVEKLVVQTEDVLVDRRGYIYITGKNEGLWILRYNRPGSEPTQ